MDHANVTRTDAHGADLVGGRDAIRKLNGVSGLEGADNLVEGAGIDAASHIGAVSTRHGAHVISEPLDVGATNDASPVGPLNGFHHVLTGALHNLSIHINFVDPTGLIGDLGRLPY